MAKRAAKSLKAEGAVAPSLQAAAVEDAEVSARRRLEAVEIRRKLKDSASKLLWNEGNVAV